MADETAGDAWLENITANFNGADDDCFGDDVCFSIAADGVEGKVTMVGVEARFNGAGGACTTGSDSTSFPDYSHEDGAIPVNDSCSGIVVDGEDFSDGLLIIGADASNNGVFGGDCDGDRTFLDSKNHPPRNICQGIIIDGRGGDIILRDVKANNNGAFPRGDCLAKDICSGIHHDPSDTVGVFSLTDVQANGNGAGGDCPIGDGLSFPKVQGKDSCFGILHDTGTVSGAVTFIRVEASGNGAGGDCTANDSCQGIVLDNGDNTGPFVFVDVTANNNGAGGDCGLPGSTIPHDNCLGILIDGGGLSCELEEEVECSDLGFAEGSFFVSLTGVEANNNGAGGDCSIARDQCSGLIIDGVRGDIKMDDVTANDNRAGDDCFGPDSCSGVIVDGDFGSITMKDVTANDNGAGGLCDNNDTCNGILIDGGSSFSRLTDIEANDNGARGDCSSDRDQCSGVIVDGGLTIWLKNVTAEGNGAGDDCFGPDSCNGVLADPDGGYITLVDVVANENGAGDDCDDASSCTGLTADGGTIVLLDLTETSENSGDGTVIDTGHIFIFGCPTSEDNGGSDFDLNPAPLFLIEDCDLEGDVEDGDGDD